MSLSSVAQTGSLLYRRLATCDLAAAACRLPVGDTADKLSALQPVRGAKRRPEHCSAGGARVLAEQCSALRAGFAATFCGVFLSKIGKPMVGGIEPKSHWRMGYV